jgi:hypothetical protein
MNLALDLGDLLVLGRGAAGEERGGGEGEKGFHGGPPGWHDFILRVTRRAG